MATITPPPPFDPFSTGQARSIVAICAVFMFIAVLGVVARFWSRSLKRTSPALDDWLIVVGLVFYLISAIVNVLQVSMGGLGHHVEEVMSDPERLLTTAKLGTYSQYVYALAMGFIRASICILLYRIFTTRPFRFAIIVVGVINGLWTIFNILIVSFRCIPFRANWDMTLTDACLDQVPIVLGVAIWGLIVELAIWSLPIPMAWSLQMSRHHKIAVSIIFGLGIFTIAIGIARVVTILQVGPLDPTWIQVPALQWITIEPAIAIVVTCMPVCRPLLEKLMPDSIRKTLRGEGTSGSRSRYIRSGQDDQIILVARNKQNNSLNDRDLEGEPDTNLRTQDLRGPNQIYVKTDFIVTGSST